MTQYDDDDYEDMHNDKKIKIKIITMMTKSRTKVTPSVQSQRILLVVRENDRKMMRR